MSMGVTPSRTLLWTQLTEECRIPSDVADMVFQGLQQAFGKDGAQKLAQAPWVKELENWRNLASEVRLLGAGSLPQAVEVCSAIVSETVFAVTRLIVQQEAATLSINMSDQEKQQEFLARGWQWRSAAAWGENNCLADSLLQLLHLHGFVRASAEGLDEASAAEREAACNAARQHLLRSAGLMPRNAYGTAQWDAYLQHHRHAKALFEFFLGRYPQGLRQVPPGGLVLVVHARYDTLQVPPDFVVLRAGSSRRQGCPMEIHVFNWTGAGLAGYHYDVLVPPAQVANEPGVIDLTETGDAEGRLRAVPRSRLKRVIGDGKGRTVSAAMVVRSPSPPQAGAASAMAASPVQQDRAPLASSSPRPLQAQAAFPAGAGAGAAGSSRRKSKAKAKGKSSGA